MTKREFLIDYLMARATTVPTNIDPVRILEDAEILWQILNDKAPG